MPVRKGPIAGVILAAGSSTRMGRNKLLLKDGVPVAALEAGEVRRLGESSYSDEELKALFARRWLRQALRPHLRTATAAESRALSRVMH